ncbi:MAG: hypothetical protein AB1568_14825 [Thermodesulfobacteriota bacterium]
MQTRKHRPSLFLCVLALFLFSAAAGHASFLHAPHDEEHGLSCGSCHAYPLDASIWPPDFPPASPTADETLRNFICLRCHDGTVDHPSELAAPRAGMHSSIAVGGNHPDWTTECIDCHDPHFQAQLAHHPDPALFLATGTVVAVDTVSQPGRTVLTCAIASARDGWPPTAWPAKTGDGRGLLLVLGAPGRGALYEVAAATGEQVTVQGVVPDHATPQDFGLIYGQLLRSEVKTPSDTLRAVRFFDPTGGFVDPGGSGQPRGLCQVCHTATGHWSPAAPIGDSHYPTRACTQCHLHKNGFAHGGGGGAECSSCHLSAADHDHRTVSTSPDCAGCHTVASQAAIDALHTSCAACHSYNGAKLDPAVVAATIAGGRGAEGSDRNCQSCHTRDHGTDPSHATHLGTGAYGLRGPMISCDGCHDPVLAPSFRSGLDADGDGRISLAETDVCNPCHSPDGPFDGVNDPNLGAKANWHYDPAGNTGIYNGALLAAGKEKWCVTCHDSGTSVIPAGSTYKPRDFAGNDRTYGYFISGHGGKLMDGNVVGCDGCHDLAASHNLDGKRTYRAALNNYRQGFRLKRMADGGEPFRIPAARNMQANDGCDYRSEDYRLCYSCHAEQTLLANVQQDGTYECRIPAALAGRPAIATGFRNVSPAGDNGGLTDVPANAHWDHLVDVHSVFMTASFWDSDQDGTNDSKATCVTCHNPHGPAGNQTDQAGQPLPTLRMTVKSLDIVSGQDGTGNFGQFGPAMSTGRCFMCHFGPGGKYYRDAVPALSGLTVADRSIPATAQSGYTNERAVRVQLEVSTVDPAEMRLSEQMFSDDATGWLPLPPTTTNPIRVTEYVIAGPGDGTKTIYAQVRNAAGRSAILNRNIVLDTSAPAVPANALTSPNGGENWRVGTTQVVGYIQLADSDGPTGNLASCPITLEYSTDGGNTYPYNLGYAYCLWLQNNDWLVPDTPTTNGKFRLTVTDRAGNIGRDASDATFTISR